MRAGVPMYPLIDRFDTRGAMATPFTEPNEDGAFKRSDAVPFGKPLTLPEPFGATLPTDGFPVRPGTDEGATPRWRPFALSARSARGPTARGLP